MLTYEEVLENHLRNEKKKKMWYTTRILNFDHKVKARAHKGDMRIGKTPKKLARIFALNAEKLKQIP
jgi:hypothetical protein